ncbi:Abi-alpha family protein [Amycolatopsis sp. NPDC058278]|uniref:Abi-alpha family protein n=1 Tax=Amycolatopsis sp. NPDC058278 TaxID=3346417 RepID=UPI0036DABACC
MNAERPNGRGAADDVADLARRAGQLAGWAARTGFALGRKLPGVETAERGVRQVERQLLTELRRRLDEVDDPYHAALTAASAMNRPAVPGNVPAAVTLVPVRDNHAEPLRAAMAELLNHSVGFGRERAREYFYAIILRQLTPDEARILAALSDGSPFPAVDVVERTGLGGNGRVVLRNASTVGKAAGVSLPDQVPGYVTRLIGLGLVDLDEEVPSLETQYEILMTDETVREAEKHVRRAKFVRRTIHVSRLGAQFWQACDPASRPHSLG